MTSLLAFAVSWDFYTSSNADIELVKRFWHNDDWFSHGLADDILFISYYAFDQAQSVSPCNLRKQSVFQTMHDGKVVSADYNKEIITCSSTPVVTQCSSFRTHELRICFDCSCDVLNSAYNGST